MQILSLYLSNHAYLWEGESISFFQSRFKTKTFPSSLTQKLSENTNNQDASKLIFESKQNRERSLFPKRKTKNTQRHTKYFFNFSSKMERYNLSDY